MNVKHCWNNYGEGVIKILNMEVNLNVTTSIFTTNATWTALELNLRHHGEKLATFVFCLKCPKLMCDTSLTTHHGFLHA